MTSPGGVYIEGCWSQAGLCTLVHIGIQNTKASILFDCGAIIPSTIKAKQVFITHGHCDHIGASIQHARANSLGGAAGPTYFMPEACVHDISVAKTAFESLDGSEIAMDIKVLKPGDSVQIPRTQFRVFPFPTTHRVPSQGYCIALKHRDLLPAYSGSEQADFKRYRKAGVDPFNTYETCELAYTGDTTFEALLSPGLEFLFTVPILIMEMTYLDGDRSKGKERGHIHLDDFLENEHLFHNERIIFMHLSEKYAPHFRALRILRERVPTYLHHRVGVCLRSFGASEDITYLYSPPSRSVGFRHGGYNSRAGESSRRRGDSFSPSRKKESSEKSERCGESSVQVLCPPCAPAVRTEELVNEDPSHTSSRSGNNTKKWSSGRPGSR